MLQDVDAIVRECGDLLTLNGINPKVAREVIVAMIEDQPLPLRGTQSIERADGEPHIAPS